MTPSGKDHASGYVRSWISRDMVTVTFALFCSAMGANSFIQYAIPYLEVVRDWSSLMATLVLIVAFVGAPFFRLGYAHFHKWFGDRGLLLVGNLLFLLYLLQRRFPQ